MARLAFLTLLALPISVFSQGQRRAVLIGIDQYDNARIESPKYAENDIVALALSLKAAGYDITLLSNRLGQIDDLLEPTKINIERSLNAVLADCKRDDLMLIAYVGHGFQSGDGAVYLCPKDAQAGLDHFASSISFDHFARDLGNCKARDKVLLIYAGGGLEFSPPKDVVTLFSRSPSKDEARNADPKHGLFCFSILEGLKGKAANGNDAVTFASLADYVRNVDSKHASQTPSANVGEDRSNSPVIANHPKALPHQEWREYSELCANGGARAFLERRAVTHLESWRSSAAAGSARAMALLGDYYETGIGQARDLAESARWYEASARRGNSLAMVRLGLCCQQGIGVEKNARAAVRWFRQAAELDDAWAMELLATCCLTGSGTAKDQGEAVRWYWKSLELGRDQAIYPLAMLYLSGSGVKTDKKEAVRLLRLGAQRNNRDCVFWLGLCYQDGMGVDKDGKEAIRWLQRGAELDHPESMFQLGVSSMLGLGIERSSAQAVAWFRKGAELGDLAAMNRLGMCYLDGLGIDEDAQEAFRWFRMAAERGDPSGMFNHGKCLLHGKGVVEDRREGVRWIAKAAAKGEPHAREILKLIDD